MVKLVSLYVGGLKVAESINSVKSEDLTVLHKVMMIKCDKVCENLL